MLDDLLNDLDRHFKTSRSNPHTYDRQERELIESKVVPEWLLRGRKLLRDTPEGKRCEAAVDALKGLYAAVWPKVEFKTDR